MKNPFLNQVSRFSIRKYSYGVASVMIGASIMLTNPVFADQINTSQSTTEGLIQTTNQEKEIAENTAITNTAITNTVSTTSNNSQIQVDQLETKAQENINEQVSDSIINVNSTDVKPPQSVELIQPTQVTNPQTIVADVPTQKSVTSGEIITNQGIYIYPENMAVRNEAKLVAPIVFYGQKREKINYHQLINADNTQWLVYKSFSGILRYVALPNKNVTPKPDATKPADAKDKKIENENIDKTNTLPASGTYTFTNEVAVKNQPKLSATTEFVFSAGESVSYDKVLVADNINWLSYLSFSGTRRYVQLDKVDVTTTPDKKPEPTKPTPEVTKVTLPACGTYTFTKEVVVKNQPKLATPIEFEFKQGETINYDKVLVSDNTSWLSYLSYSGTRRYIQLDQVVVAPTPDKPTKPSPKPTDTNIYPKGRLEYHLQNNGDFTIKVSEVNNNLAIKEMKIPVWSEEKGQDDLVWYTAKKQNDGTYSLTVKLSNHKNMTGLYHVDLYYKTDAGNLLSVLKTKLEVPKNVVVTPSTPAKPTKPDLPVANTSGTIVLTKDLEVRSQPSLSSKPVASYKVGMSVNYDRTLEAEGYRWISYVSFSGVRRYLAISKL
ncbi:SH3 domain-containing protein [Streptococcus parauberis]|uniref:SH3 domain-containing protein n=2 Tax=Streptococcus parauberis TaxID=1348 RepID=UPI0002BA52D1|nr:SH3 domain-containing protein [Streptococcus parauberis]EMF49745.1 N-acetylmuramoyl-L-alanine amidase [Streptococcus parauberis KRS-02109]UWM87849.1 SH3 domain-containing protein [Streptococcus parauberis]UWM89821.1 SH3 domain-containing protein [Streptococcus parauberis]WEM60434.1 SH3 domain-containing protein [Streptococcus parauberis]